MSITRQSEGRYSMGIVRDIEGALQDIGGSGVHARIIIPDDLSTSPEALLITVKLTGHNGDHTVSHLTLTVQKQELVAPDLEGSSISLYSNDVRAEFAHEASSTLEEPFPIADREERSVSFTIPYGEFFDSPLTPPLKPDVDQTSDPAFFTAVPGRHEIAYELELDATVDGREHVLRATNRFTVFARNAAAQG